MGWPWQPAQLSHPRLQNPLGLFRVGKPKDKTPRIPALLWWYRPQDGFNVHPRAWRWGEDPSEVMWFSSDECEKFTYGRGEHPCWFLCPFVGTVPNGKSNTIIITSNHKRQVCVCVCALASVCARAARTLLSTVLYVLPEEMLGLLQNSHKSQTYSLVFTFFFFYYSFIVQGCCCLAEDWALLGARLDSDLCDSVAPDEHNLSVAFLQPSCCNPTHLILC